MLTLDISTSAPYVFQQFRRYLYLIITQKEISDLEIHMLEDAFNRLPDEIPNKNNTFHILGIKIEIKPIYEQLTHVHLTTLSNSNNDFFDRLVEHFRNHPQFVDNPTRHMPEPSRNASREKWFEYYNKHPRKKTLKEIAGILNLSYGYVRQLNRLWKRENLPNDKKSNKLRT